MRNKALLVIVVILGGIYFGIQNFKDRVALFNRRLAGQRQLSVICQALASGKVSRDEVCSMPVPEIPTFKYFYARIAQQDGAWYQRHSWDYYPSVQCSGERVEFALMDLTFVCQGSAASEIARLEPEYNTSTPSLIADAAIGAEQRCFEQNSQPRSRFVEAVQDDGTLVLDKNTRAYLLGVKLAQDALSAEEEKRKCIAQAVSYISARVLNKTVTTYALFDGESALSQGIGVFVLDQQSNLLNQDLLKYGLAQFPTDEAARAAAGACAVELERVQNVARAKKAGLWQEGCFATAAP